MNLIGGISNKLSGQRDMGGRVNTFEFRNDISLVWITKPKQVEKPLYIILHLLWIKIVKIVN